MDPFAQKHTKLFGSSAERVSTAELGQIVAELRAQVGDVFGYFQAVKPLPIKPDHGDIDILVMLPKGTNLRSILTAKLGSRMMRYSANGHTISVLYRSSYGKTVHVDFIVSNTPENLKSHTDYYMLNDFSQIVGAMAKQLNFKYGSEGFFKRFRDNKSVWHDLFITHDLMDGLRILGFSNVESRVAAIHNHEDIVNFVTSSPLYDSSFFEEDKMRAVDRQAVRKRHGSEYMYKLLRAKPVNRKVDDEDFFFKRLFPEQYAQVEAKKEEINTSKPNSKKYDGHWIMDHFHIKPGPKLGRLLKSLSQKFGDSLDSEPENVIYDFIAGLLGT